MSGSLEVILSAAGLRFVRLGQSRVGGLLADLLSAQGMIASQSHEIGSSVDAVIDVVIDDRTGEDEKSDTLAWRRPDSGAIYIRFTDFPETHPRWTGKSALSDDLIHAELGLNRVGGGAPEPEPLPIASAYGAMWGAVYVAASLALREGGKRGHYVRWPLFSAGVTVMARQLLTIADQRWKDPLTGPHLPFQEIFECKDGRYVQNQGTFARFIEVFCKVSGREAWSKDAVEGLYRLPDRATEEMWRSRFAATFKERPALEWERVLNEVAGACTMCRTNVEWATDAHARSTDMIVEDGKGARVGPAVRLAVSKAPPAAAAQPWKPSGSPGKPLAGLRVVDFALILAGPTCGRTLAELGAEVIKVDAIDRHILEYGWLDVNRGKRSLALDMKKPEGREIARRLVSGVHVVVENLRAGKMAELGVGFADAQKLRPGIVYASLNAFDYDGTRQSNAGWEHNAQAVTGMQIGRARNGVPRAVPVPVNDYGTGLLGAYGVLMGLRTAMTTDQGVHVRGSLSRTASFVQSAQFSHRPDLAAAETRVFACAGGWVRAAGLTGDASDLAPKLVGMGVDEALALLRSRGAIAAVERTVADLRADSLLDEAGMRVTWNHRHWGSMQQSFAVPDKAAFRPEPGWAAPDAGDDGVDILTSLGYSSADIAALERSGALCRRRPLFKAA